MSALLQLLGATIVLVPFVANLRGAVTTSSVPYLVPNIVGSLLLAMLALHDRQWGFLLLEVVWASVSAHGLLRRAIITA